MLALQRGEVCVGREVTAHRQIGAELLAVLPERGVLPCADHSKVRQGEQRIDIARSVFVRGPRDVDDAVNKSETGALVFLVGVESNGPGRACKSCGNGYWGAGLFIAGRKVNGVQALIKSSACRIHGL